MLTARSGDQLEEIAAQLRTSDRVVATAAVDLTNPSDLKPAFANLMSEGDVPSVLINNAGAAYTGDLLAMPLEHWQWLLPVSYTHLTLPTKRIV